MSIIAVKKVPMKWSIAEVMKKLAQAIKGPFEVLNFDAKKKQPTKVCYVRLSAKLDPVRVVECINNHEYPKFVKLFAFIPENIPDLPLAKKRNVPRKFRHSIDLPELLEPYQVCVYVHQEILTEMQAKFPELYNLSLKTAHRLIQEICKVLFERLRTIMDNHPDAVENCFRLSQFYRKMHPHFGDFELVLSTLHKLQDETGAPRIQLNESELAKFDPKAYTIGNLPFAKVQKYCSKYNNKMYDALKKHISSWDMNVDPNDEESVIRNKIRHEITKIMPFMPTILSQLSTKHLMPEDVPHHKVRIYGEPFMPNKDLLQPLLKKYIGNVRVIRSNRIYNMIRFKIPQNAFLSLMALDGTVIHGAKLLIRNDMPTYPCTKALKDDFLRSLGAPLDMDADYVEEPDDDDQSGGGDNEGDDDDDFGEEE